MIIDITKKDVAKVMYNSTDSVDFSDEKGLVIESKTFGDQCLNVCQSDIENLRNALDYILKQRRSVKTLEDYDEDDCDF